MLKSHRNHYYKKPVTFSTEQQKVYSAIPYISFEKAIRMIRDWGYNVKEVLSYKDKHGRHHQTNFNQWQLLKLEKIELACKSLSDIKQQVRTSLKEKSSQLYFVVGGNEERIRENSIHYEIGEMFSSLQADKFQHNEVQRIFHSNKNLLEYCY